MEDRALSLRGRHFHGVTLGMSALMVLSKCVLLE